VQRCALARLAEIPAPARAVSIIEPAPGDTWWTTWRASRRARTSRGEDAVAALFDRVETEIAFATVSLDDTATGVGMAVLDGRWLGIFNMATQPAQRRRGAGRAALRTLAAWGLERGAEHAYLQVELDNVPAQRLYRTAGFEPAYEYVYLTRTIAST
jgi:ribosomal protein S18 acetylase RimI-like enzyme